MFKSNLLNMKRVSVKKNLIGLYLNISFKSGIGIMVG